jgi:hypothetical protein
VRFAARQIIITLDPLLDPERGRGAPPEPWDRLLAKMAADDVVAERRHHVAGLAELRLEHLPRRQGRAGEERGQHIITLDPLLDPERGRGAPPEPWDRLLAKMAADDEGSAS